MRVTIANSFFPPWRGGAETYVFNLANELANRGHQVTVHCGNEPLMPGRERIGEVVVVRHKILARVYGTPFMPGLLRALRHVSSDVLHGNFPSPYVAATVALASKTRQIPAVLTWHNDLPPVTLGAKVLVEAHDRLLLPRYLPAFRRVIATSETYAKQSRILGSLGSQVGVVTNGVDCQHFNPSVSGARIRQRLRLGNKFTIIFVGALTKWHTYKGLETLLHAVRLTAPKFVKTTLVIVGDGELKGYYESLSQNLGIKERVTFAGNVCDDTLPQFYAASDLLVLPSKDMSEGFGLTILEANATGKPVIASSVGGIPSLVDNGYNGILVRPNDPKALSLAILGMINNPKETRRMGRNGRRVAESHDWKRTAEKTEQVYAEALLG